MAFREDYLSARNRDKSAIDAHRARVGENFPMCMRSPLEVCTRTDIEYALLAGAYSQYRYVFLILLGAPCSDDEAREKSLAFLQEHVMPLQDEQLIEYSICGFWTGGEYFVSIPLFHPSDMPTGALITREEAEDVLLSAGCRPID